MKQNKYFSAFLIIVFIGLLSWQTVTAQESTEPEIELPQLYTSTTEVAFRYPADWTLTDINTDNENIRDDFFVSVTNGTITIEFYTQGLSGSIIDLAGGNLENSLQSFLDIVGITVPATNPPTPLATTTSFNSEDVIGAFIVDTGEGQYILLGNGRFMEEDEYIFIRVTGAAISLLDEDNINIAQAIIDSFGDLATQESSSSSNGSAPVTNPNPPVTVQDTASTEPCIISATGEGQTTMRVGPGTNRGVVGFLGADEEFTVIGTNTASDGSTWWRLDKSQAAPASAANEIWVADSQVTQVSEGCSAVDTLNAPPIIAVRPDPVSTTPDEPVINPEPPAGSTEPFVNFYAATGTIFFGECTSVIWDVRNVSFTAFEFLDNTVPNQSNVTVCPEVTTTYSLYVTLESGQTDTYTTTIFVQEDGFVECLSQELPYFREGYLNEGDVQFFTIFIDPCQTPMTIWIEMYSTEIDPLINVFVEDVYYGSDDDSGGNLNAYIEVFLPAGTSYVLVEAMDFNGEEGSFEILADFVFP